MTETTGGLGLRRGPAILILGLLMAPAAVLGVLQARADSVTIDEGVYISAGVTAITDHRLHLVPEHPPLAKLVVGASALPAGVDIPRTEAYREGRWFDYTEEVWEAQGDRDDQRELAFWARLLPLAVTLGSGAALYALGARLHGRAAGLVAAGLWLTVPHVVGVGHFAVTDLVFAAAVILSSITFVRHLQQPSDGAALLMGLAVGAAMLSRHLGLLLVPVAVVVAVVADRSDGRAAARRAGLAAVVSWVSVWALYRVVAPGGPPDESVFLLETLVATGEARSPWVELLLSIPWPLEYRAGLAYLAAADTPTPAYLLGMAWEGKRWWYFPLLAAVKLPAVTLLAVVGGGGLAMIAMREERRFRLLVTLYLPAVVLVIGVAVAGRNIGVRYLLAPLALLVAAGAVALGPHLHRRWLQVVAAAAVVVQGAVLVASHPHSLAWVTPPIDQAYRAVTDSDVDWGQDLRRLTDFTETVDEPVWVDLLRGRANEPVPNTRGLERAPDDEPLGWVAVSASRLTAYDRDELMWLWPYCPVEVVGASILVYRFEHTVPDRSLTADVPAAPCDDAEESHR